MRVGLFGKLIFKSLDRHIGRLPGVVLIRLVATRFAVHRGDPWRRSADRHVVELQGILVRQGFPALQCCVHEIRDVVVSDDPRQFCSVDEEDEIGVRKSAGLGEHLTQSAIPQLQGMSHQCHLRLRQPPTARPTLRQSGQSANGRRRRRLIGSVHRPRAGVVEYGPHHDLHHRAQPGRVLGPRRIAHTQLAIPAVAVATQEVPQRGTAGTVRGLQ